MPELRDVVIISAKRTPVGAFQGNLSSVSASQLGSTAIKAVLEETKVDLNSIDEVIMGNVLSAGQGQAPARQAALGAGLPDSVECLTINKMCGSGLKAVMLATQAIGSKNPWLIAWEWYVSSKMWSASRNAWSTSPRSASSRVQLFKF